MEIHALWLYIGVEFIRKGFTFYIETENDCLFHLRIEGWLILVIGLTCLLSMVLNRITDKTR